MSLLLWMGKNLDGYFSCRFVFLSFPFFFDWLSDYIVIKTACPFLGLRAGYIGLRESIGSHTETMDLPPLVSTFGWEGLASSVSVITVIRWMIFIKQKHQPLNYKTGEYSEAIYICSSILKKIKYFLDVK